MKANINVVKAAIIAVILTVTAVTVHAGGAREQTGGANGGTAGTAQSVAELNAINNGSAAVNGVAESPWALKPKLVESLGKYMAPEIQTWGNEGDVSVYLIDANRFNEFKAELDAGGEYRQADSWTDNNRDWNRGLLFARLGVLPDGRLNLDLGRADNSLVGYRYTKRTSGALGLKLQESLRKYMVPQMQNWGNDGDVSVYNVDADRFNEFKAELDAGGEYLPHEVQRNGNRNWDRGKTFAQFLVYHNKGEYGLRLGKSDNSVVSYSYIKLPQAGEPKTILITGFNGNTPVWVNKNGVRGRNFWMEVKPVTEFEPNAYCWVTNPDQDVTFELTLAGLTKDDKEMEYRWTGTGSYYIGIGGFLDNRGYHDLKYYYSANGTSPTPVEIKDAVTTLNWSDFIRDSYEQPFF